jgi:hypothetical protein
MLLKSIGEKSSFPMSSYFELRHYQYSICAIYACYIHINLSHELLYLHSKRNLSIDRDRQRKATLFYTVAYISYLRLHLKHYIDCIFTLAKSFW